MITTGLRNKSSIKKAMKKWWPNLWAMTNNSSNLRTKIIYNNNKLKINMI